MVNVRALSAEELARLAEQTRDEVRAAAELLASPRATSQERQQARRARRTAAQRLARQREELARRARHQS